MAWHMLHAQVMSGHNSDPGRPDQQVEEMPGAHIGVWIYTILEGYIGDESPTGNPENHTDVSGSRLALVASWPNGPLRRRDDARALAQGEGRLYIDEASYRDPSKRHALEGVFNGLPGSPVEVFSALHMETSTAASFEVSAHANRDPPNTGRPDEFLVKVASLQPPDMESNWAAAHWGTVVLQIPASGVPTAGSMARDSLRHDEDLRCFRTNVTSYGSTWVDAEVLIQPIRPWKSTGNGELYYIMWEWPTQATRDLRARAPGTPSYSADDGRDQRA